MTGFLKFSLNKIIRIFCILIIISSLYIISLYNYLLFHSIVEIVSVIIAFGVFIIAWNSRHFLSYDFFLFLGIAYLFIGSMDFIHTLAFKGMNIFKGYDTDLASQLWIAARYTGSISIIIASLFLNRKIKKGYVFTGFFTFFVLVMLSIFYWENFPECFNPGSGLTSFKIISEYIISIILLIAIVILIRKKEEFDENIQKLIVISLAINIISEMAFTLYVDVYGFSNMLGHIFKILSFYFIYEAIIVIGIREPYNLLLKNLVQSKEDLRKSKEFSDNLIATAQVIILVLDNEGKIVLFNPYMEELSGNQLEDMKGKDWFTSFLPEEDQGEIHHVFLNVCKDIKITKNINTIVTKNNKKIYIEWYSKALKDHDGHILGILSVGLDITERKQIEERLKTIVTKLQNSNRDLEQFAYIASHDLQEPLRAISSFTDLLAMRYKGKLDSSADEYIGFITKGASQMQQLINDLLDFSRISTRDKENNYVDVAIVIGKVIANLRIFIEKNNAVVTNDILPVVLADESQLIRLFQNLIENAIKFHREISPHIHISAYKHDNEWIFSVRDNGIGIEPQYFEKIFEVFQRLHTKKEYPGTGIGLAICKKIIERHNGRIWVESKMGEGTSFYFSIPILKQNKESNYNE